jgi:uncharacterized protein (TIGR02118 family)
MVKLVYCLRRLRHLTREEFQHYWRENHGPLVQGTAAPVGIRRYVQTHTIDYIPKVNQRQTNLHFEPFDGVAELWYDRIDSLMPAQQTPEHRQAINSHVEDESTFIDRARSPLWFADEHVFINEMPELQGSENAVTAIKLVYCLRRLPHLTREEFQHYWRENHGPLVQKQKDVLGIRRYVQSHTGYDEHNEILRAGLGRPNAFDGVAELWWDNIETYSPENQTPERRAAGQELFEDEQRFIDVLQSPRWLAIEHVFVK